MATALLRSREGGMMYVIPRIASLLRGAGDVLHVPEPQQAPGGLESPVAASSQLLMLQRDSKQ